MRQVLLETDSSVDRAIPLLFERDTQERRREHAAEKLKLMERAFAGLPPQLIQAIVKKNDGDIDASSAELLHIMQERQEQEELALVNARKEATRQKQEQGRHARLRFVEHCVKTFDCLTRDEIVAVLSSGSGGDSDAEVSKVVAKLTGLSNERKARNLAAIFARVPRADIVRALESCAYDMQTACETLTNRVAADAHTRPDMSLKDQLDRTVHEALDAMGKPATADAEDAQLLQSMIRRAIGPSAESPQPDQQQHEQQQQQLDLDAVMNQTPVDGLRVVLETDAVNFPYGSSVPVRVVATDGAVSTYDWIALCTPEQPAGAYLSYQWYQPTLSFALPAYGTFELRFMRKQDGQHQCLARSEPLLCGPAVALDTTVSADGSVWSVTWATPAQGSEAVTSSAWIGLYDVAAAHASFIAFQYVSLDSRTLDFKAPRKNGQYVFRFFARRFGLVAVSAPVAVQKDDTVTLRHEGSTLLVDVSLATVDPVERKRCWVGVFFSNEDRSSYYRRYAWLSKSADRFSFKTPIHAGTYEVRVYDEKNLVVAKSDSFVVGA